MNIVTTIKTFYKLLSPNLGRTYGNHLLKSHFYGGICLYYKKEDVVKELLDQYQKYKKEEEKKKQLENKS